MYTVIAIAGLLIAVWYFARMRELFVLSIRDGQTLLVRGHIPRNLLIALQEVLAHPPVPSGTVKAVRTEQGAQLSASGDIDERRVQRMRNIFGMYPVSQLSDARTTERRTLGQLLGIVWLAWWFDRRS
ncbi:MAG TPA: DUF3634 family protein [Polyangia bacterium]|jgi:hypothetical protein|nr:DUF3634 family protein [Polyangia bacterium]